MSAEPLAGNGAFPLYLQIVANLEHAIDTGEYAVGDKIPTEAELMDAYGVSRITVRRAISDLVEAGYLQKQQGRGTFVMKSAKTFRIVRSYHGLKCQSFTEGCELNGRTAGSIDISRSHVVPTAEEQAFFGVGPDHELLEISRVRTADDVPIMIDDTRFLLPEFSFLENADLDHGSAYKLIAEHFGEDILIEGKSTLSSAKADSETARLLNVPVGEPLFVIEGAYEDKDGRPVYMGKMLVVGARYEFAL